MLTSSTAVANLALGSIGNRTSIAALTEASSEARACLRQYDSCLDDVLAAAHWNFARKQLALTLLKDGTASPPDSVPAPWLYEYAYPSDCVAARYIQAMQQTDAAAVAIFGSAFTTASQTSQIPAVRFLISNDEDSQGNPSKVILTNQPAATLVYTMRLTNVSLFDSMFVRALAFYLGAQLALELTGDKALARQAFQIADTTTKAARASNGNEGITVIDPTPEWMAIRGVGSDYAGSSYILSPTDLQFIA